MIASVTCLVVLSAGVAAAAPAFPHCTPAGCVAFSPFDDVTAAFTGTIAAARKSVRVAVFNITSPAVTGALIERARAGVDVDVMVDFSRPENDSMKRLLAEPGVRFIRVPSLRGGGPQMHEKLMLVDDDEVVAGTGNYTEPAFVSSVETFLETREPAVVAAARAELDALEARASAACALFARSSPSCPAGRVTWDKAFDAYARTGRFRPQDIVIGPRCAGFVAGRERLEVWPVDRSRSDVKACVRDPRFLALVHALHPPPPPTLWTRARGLLLADPAPPRAPVAWLSSRTVDIEEVLLQALARPQPQPPLVGLSRLHAKNVLDALARDRAVVTVGSFLHEDAAGSDSGVRLLSKLPDALVIDDGFLTHGSLFHDKSALVGDRVFFSSANWSAQAFQRNDESFFAIDDPALVALFRQNLVRARALAGASTPLAAGVPPPTPIAVIRVALPEDVDPRAPAVLDVAGRTVALRWDGTRPVRLVGAIEGRNGHGDVVIAGVRTPVSWAVRGVASIEDARVTGEPVPALPHTAPAP